MENTTKLMIGTLGSLGLAIVVLTVLDLVFRPDSWLVLVVTFSGWIVGCTLLGATVLITGWIKKRKRRK